jgi:hypothetical protein
MIRTIFGDGKEHRGVRRQLTSAITISHQALKKSAGYTRNIAVNFELG